MTQSSRPATASHQPDGDGVAAGRHSPALDGIRALAFLLVFAYHSGYGLGGPAMGGWVGVDIFFVLSGYLITTLLLARWDPGAGVDVPAFWLRRLARLYPALVLTVVLVAVLVAVVPGAGAELEPSWALAPLTYTLNVYLGLNDAQFGALGHTSTLGIEGQL